jgi:hypothetical protein
VICSSVSISWKVSSTGFLEVAGGDGFHGGGVHGRMARRRAFLGLLLPPLARLAASHLSRQGES